MFAPLYFDSVNKLTAGARGVPGQRTFYLLVSQKDTRVRLWLEKEQLQMLALAIGQILATLSRHYSKEVTEPEGEAGPVPEPEGLVAAEFKVGRLALGYDEDRDRLLLSAHELDIAEGGMPALRCWATRGQMGALSQRITAVCAAGRPRCPLCGGPIDPGGHVCSRRNGHQSLEGLEERT